jgi:KAP family P-loop domain
MTSTPQDGPADRGRFVVLSDVPALDGIDALGFEAVASRLERIILASRSSTPFTASIEAGWGAGKSTLMRRVQRRLEGTAPDQTGASTGVRTVWFNAWAAPEAQALEGLIRSVLDQLDTNVLRRIARKRKLLSGLRLAVSLVAGFFRVGNVVDRIWEQVSIDPKQRNALNDFVREAMTTWLAKPSQREGRLIVVFVDDLDRCSSSTVLQVFEAMKLYLDAPGFVFVLGWDTEQVLRAVAAEKGTEDRLPQRYVEKIVQFGFRIPRPTDDQLAQLTDSLCEAAGVTDYVLAREHRQLLMNTTGGNPRQLKRFINRFILLHELVGETADDAAVIQLMFLQASYDTFYRLLANVPGDSDEVNPLFEFTDYVNAKEALNKGQMSRATEILTARGFDHSAEGPREQLQAFVQELPPDYPLLAADRQFTQLVLAMSDDVKRELRRLARSEQVQSVQSAMADATLKVSPQVDYGETSVSIAPGTPVLWIDDHPDPADHAVLPPGVNLILATSTEEAKSTLSAQKQPIALLISDIGRGDDRDAGLDGLRDIRESKLYDGPAVFYTLRPTRGQVDEASKWNAQVTSSPDELRTVVQRLLPVAQSSPRAGSAETYSAAPS